MTTDLTEFNKLEEWMRENHINYERRSRLPFTKEVVNIIGEDERIGEKNQLVVFDRNGKIKYDVICHKGSFGCDEGLLEIYGEIVPKGCLGGVEGYLIAEEVIERIKEIEVKE